MPLRRNPQFILICCVAFLLSIAGLIGAESQIKSVLVYVELQGEPAVDVAVRLQEAGTSSNKITRATQKRIAELKLQQQLFIKELEQVQGNVESQFFRLANAVKVRLPIDQVEQVYQIEGVVDVTPVAQFHPLTSTSIPFIKATDIWNREDFSVTGKGVRIGIIDSGIDYTHAMFGGSGKESDYESNDPRIIEKGSFPTKKVAGGYDFAGDDYDGTKAPRPDRDPIDCAANSHGSHVAGIAAGVGVLTNGKPYTSGYTKPLEMDKFLIGPGVAPEAQLYALKVFGCAGTTGLSVDAMEWASDPNGDGDFADRLDVVNLSLGTSYTRPEFEGNAASRLVKLGCAVVRAAGNSGNNFYSLMVFDDSEITVANSIDDGVEYDSIEVTSPAALRGHYEAVEAGFTRRLEDIGEIKGKVVYADPPQACSALKNTDEIKGNIAIINRGICFFFDKIKRAKDAGARAVIVVNNEGGPPIPMGTSGGLVDIPAVMITRRDGLKLIEQSRNGVSIKLGGDFTILGGVELSDQLAPSSSRGPVYETHRLKPDLAAPGFNIQSARAGGGDSSLLSAGTSMAAPHVVGVAALLLEQHQDWTPNSIKAAMMNTAIQIRDENNEPYPESRAGAGRVNPQLAIDTSVIVFDGEHPGRVSLSFGLLEITGPYSEDRKLTLKNFSSEPWDSAIVISDTSVNKGIKILPNKTTITVPALGQTTVNFKLSIDPSEVELGFDATTPPEVKGGPRHIVYEASGQIWFRGESRSVHVPFHMLIRLVGDHRVEESRISVTNSDNIVPLILPIVGGSAHSSPLVSAFQLGYKSPSRGYEDRDRASRDLIAIGAASDASELDDASRSTLYFGVAMDGSWIVPQSFLTDLKIDVDTDLDGKTDVELTNGSSGDVLASGDITERELADDSYYTLVRNLKSDEYKLGGILNVFPSSKRDTSLLNNSVMVLSVKASELGLPVDNYSIQYRFRNIYESTRWIPFHIDKPALRTINSNLDNTPFHDVGKIAPMRLDRDALSTHGYNGAVFPKLLLLFHHNNFKDRFDIVSLHQGNLDSDGDGMLDQWELNYFNSIAKVDGSTDHDGDNFPDISEFIAGTDPLDDESLLSFMLPVDVIGEKVLLRWESIPNRRYRIERSNGDSSRWEMLASGLLADSTRMSYIDSRIDNGLPVLYRLVVEED
ncbi:MAG: S8 family serine peptidase [Verrucomicrobiota bacterium]|nr:S8 family serine peptidase [Verrucomicrobiota bacterium]